MVKTAFTGIFQRKELLLFILFCLLEIGCSSRIAPPKGTPQIYFVQVEQRIVHIGQSKDKNKPDSEIGWLGTGFFIDEKGTIFTAKHLFQSPNFNRDNIIIRLKYDRNTVLTFPAKLIWEHKEKDIALLITEPIKTADGCTVLLKQLPYFRLIPSIDYINAFVWENILIAGYPVLGNSNLDVPIFRSGILSSSAIFWGKNPMLLLDLSGLPGFSGSPVILEKTGDVIGVVFGPGILDRSADFLWATPISTEELALALLEIEK